MRINKRFLISAVAAALFTISSLGAAAEMNGIGQNPVRHGATGMHMMPGSYRQPMGGMMGNCPMGGMMGNYQMMRIGNNLSPQQRMHMQADMMRAMASIIDKYAAQAPSSQHP
ncbi:MAG: hypothetical protein KGQ58_09010 [Proteobacteria bacterium]|nr:hypothetical protein [Pseudomonadota bacterium]